MNQDEKKTISQELNVLLASLEVYYQNLRGFHWNIKGNKFFELHLKFEELYTQAALEIDEVAERILTLEHSPLHTYEDFLEHSAIASIRGLERDQEIVSSLMGVLQTLIEKEKSGILTANQCGDEGTVDLLTTHLKEHEKALWMFKAWSK